MSKRKFLLLLKRTAIAVSAFLVISGIAWFSLNGRDNFHTVVKDKVYRSGQFNSERLDNYVRKYGIKSVLNLRGQNETAAWWQDEVAACAKLGVKHYDLSLSAKSIPSQQQMDELLTILKDSPKPLLIHCAHGADRSALASAIYLRHFEGYSCQQARKQLSILYGHLSFYRHKIGEAFNEFCNEAP